MDTFLVPIENPKGLMMKLVYFFTRKQFGKVLMPLKVHSARLPIAFGMFYGKISQLDKKLTLAPETVMLIREKVARINVCLFCVDLGRWFTIKESMNQDKFNALEQYNTSPLFTDAERAVLDYVTELTKDNISLKTEIKEIKAENVELRKDNAEFKVIVKELIAENVELRKDNAEFKVIIKQLVSESEDGKFANMLLDVFGPAGATAHNSGFVKENIFEHAKHKYPNIKNRSNNKIMPILSEFRHKDNAEVKQFITDLKFNVNSMIVFHGIIQNRNAVTHFVDNGRYNDIPYMLEQLDYFENKINELKENSNFFPRKNDLIEFAKNITKQCTSNSNI